MSPYQTIEPYEILDHVFFDAPEHGLNQEELCRGADDLWRSLRAKLPPAPTLASKATLVFTDRQQSGRWTLLRYLSQSQDDWSVWLVSNADENTTTLQLCPSLLHYFPKGPPAYLFIKACWK